MSGRGGLGAVAPQLFGIGMAVLLLTFVLLLTLSL